jgi:hypothetical protein
MGRTVGWCKKQLAKKAVSLKVKIVVHAKREKIV